MRFTAQDLRKGLFQGLIYSLTALFVVISLGFNLHIHYCGDKMSDYSLFGNAKSCYELMGEERPVDLPSDKDELKEKSCCSDFLFACSFENERKELVAVSRLPVVSQKIVGQVFNTGLSSTRLILKKWSFDPPFLRQCSPTLLQVFRL